MLSDETRQAVVDAFQAWTGGNQSGAVDRLRPLADEGEPAALALIVWFLHQMGEPAWRDGIPYARAALEKGMPWVVGYYYGNMLNDPNLRQSVGDFLRPAIEAGWPVDPIGNALAPFQQGDAATALALVDVATVPRPYPHAWNEFLTNARREFSELSKAAGVVSERRDAAVAAIEAHEQAVGGFRATVETETKQFETLLDQLTNAEAQTFFDSEATKNELEGRSLWRWGVGILTVAAVLAILPIAIYYIGKVAGKDWFADQNLVAAHFAPAIALSAVAGVILARARGRDRARQKARDLSVALGTMFVYSNQIADEESRERFLSEMGRTIIEAFLRHEGGSRDDDGRSLLTALRTTT